MTVEWWNDLWLNEGFATYIEYKGMAAFETEWDTESMFLTQDLFPVLDLDATLGSHPIVFDEVESPDQINAVFDQVGELHVADGASKQEKVSLTSARRSATARAPPSSG